MQNNDIRLIRDFYHRYKKISHTSGYQLVYDTLSLIREFIPCWQIGISTGKPKTDDPENVELGVVPLVVATPIMGHTQNLFYEMLSNNHFAKRYATYFMHRVVAGDPIEARSFYETDDEQTAKGVPHRFYKIVNTSDVVMIGGLIAHHQFIYSPLTQGYYAAYLVMARNNGQIFQNREKRLLELFFDIFLEDFRNKISCPENSRFLPYLTGEKVDSKTKIEAVFSSGTKFKPRELATIKACFDLKQNQQKITRTAIANYLHLQNKDASDALELRKAIDKVDYDTRKIKEQILRNFNNDDLNDNSGLQEFELEHIADVFKTYAYFGLYPHIPKGNERFISYLSNRLDKYR